MQIYIDVAQVEAYRLPICNDTGTPGLVEQPTELAQTPAKTSPGIIRDVP